MSQEDHTMKGRSFKHIAERERYTIELLLKRNLSIYEISVLLGKHKRTIEREIIRGTVRMLNTYYEYENVYCADAGQRVYLANASNKGPGLKIGHDHRLAEHIEKKIIKDSYSPDAVIGEIRAKELNFDTSICTKTLYNYIDQNVFAKITNKDLPVKRNGKKRGYSSTRVAHNNLKGTSIELRPAVVETREEYGHWEMDLVLGGIGKGKNALLVLTERQSRQQIIRKIDDKTQRSVQQAIDKLERKTGRRFKEIFKTITVDNGSEFLDSERLESSIKDPSQKRFKLYYAHPYSAWERGSNENANKLIRRFIPKGASISKLRNKDIQRIENWMNNYPRRILGYQCANDLAA